VTLQHTCRKLGVVPAVNALIAEVERLWANFDSPSPMEFTEGYWTAGRGEADLQ
jgi:hypothetical protein